MKAFTDAAADAIARAIAGVQRDAARAEDLRQAEHRAFMAEEREALEQLKRNVAERLANVRNGLDGRDGERGRDADFEDVRRAAVEAVAALPPAPAGRDADLDVVRAIVAELVARLPPGAAGEKGEPGRDVDPEQIRAMVADAVAALPLAQNGKDGADGIGTAGAFINRDGALVLTMTDGTVHNLGVVVGRDGVDGRSGQIGENGKSGLDGLSLVTGDGPPSGEMPVGTTYIDRNNGNLYQAIA